MYFYCIFVPILNLFFFFFSKIRLKLPSKSSFKIVSQIKIFFETVFTLFLFRFIRYLKTVLDLFWALRKPWKFLYILKEFKNILKIIF